MNETQEVCPQCPNHCPKDNLQCGRGRAFFADKEDGATSGSQSFEHGHGAHDETSQKSEHGHGGHGYGHHRHGGENGHGMHEEKPRDDEQNIVGQLRMLGHSLHFGGEISEEELCKSLTEEEIATLRQLLHKILQSR